MAESEHPPTDEEKDFQSLVSEASHHVKEVNEARDRPMEPTRSYAKAYLLGVLSILLLGAVGWNIYFFMYAGAPSLAFEETALRASLFLAQQAVEIEVEESGQLPTSLDDVGADEDGLSYSVSGEGYTLTATGERQVIIFNRGDDLTPFESAFQALLAREVTR